MAKAFLTATQTSKNDNIAVDTVVSSSDALNIAELRSTVGVEEELEGFEGDKDGAAQMRQKLKVMIAE